MVAVVFVARNINSRSPLTTFAGFVITGEAVAAQVDSTTLTNRTPPPGDGDGLALADGETLRDDVEDADAEGLRLAEPTGGMSLYTTSAAPQPPEGMVHVAESVVPLVTIRSCDPPMHR